MIANFRLAPPRIAGLVLAASLAGCSGGGPSSLAPAASTLGQLAGQTPASMSRSVNAISGRVSLPPTYHTKLPGAPAVGGRLGLGAAAKSSGVIYVSDFGNNAVFVYSAASPGSPPVATITAGMSQPLGNCIDKKGTLYVANSANSTVSEYRNGSLTPSKILSVGLAAPSGCVVGSNGTLYIAEFSSDAVVEYTPGGKKPVRTLSLNKPEGVALDAAGNLYVSYITLGGNGAVEEYAPASTNGTDLGILVGYAGDVKVDAAGDILLEDQISPYIDFFKPGQTQPYGSLKVGYGAFKFALNKSGTLLYAAAFNDVVGIFDAQPNGSGVGDIVWDLSESSGVSTLPAYVP